MSKQATLYSLQTERYALASLAKNNDLFPEIDSFCQEDIFYNSTHQIIFRAIKQGILSKEKYNNVLLTAKIQSLGITRFEDDLDIGDYIDSIFNTPIKKEEGLGYFKTLISFKIKRNIHELGVQIADTAKNPTFEKPQQIITEVDKLYSNLTKSLNSINEVGPVNIFENMKGYIEDLGANPPDPSKMMFGPFPTINSLYGSLSKPGNITMIGARTAAGKSSYAMFYNLFIAQTYNLPILWLDHSEMQIEELQLRAAACLTKGFVNLYAIESGEWRRNAEFTKAIRDVWPIVEKLKLYYLNVGSYSPNEVISAVRRFYYNKVGRGNQMLWVYDYIKPFDVDNDNTPEWKMMGHFIQEIKTFITDEIPLPFFTSIQLNRYGITNNKRANEVDDSENTISISDRITQQTSHTFILRRKVNEEIQKEGNLFGNLKQIPVKIRHLGKDAERALKPVKTDSGSYVGNYVNLSLNNFWFEDMGDCKLMHQKLQEIHDLQDQEGGKEGDLI